MSGPSVTVVCSYVSSSVYHRTGLSASAGRPESNLKLTQDHRPLPLAPAQKRHPLEQMHVLLVLEQRAVQRRDQFLGVALAQRLWRNVLVEQKLEPVEQLRSGRLLL